MGRIPTGKRRHELKRLTKLHINILERLVRGHKPKDIARDFGICEQTICNVRNSTAGREVLAQMNAERDAVYIVARDVNVVELILKNIDDYPEVKELASRLYENYKKMTDINNDLMYLP